MGLNDLVEAQPLAPVLITILSKSFVAVGVTYAFLWALLHFTQDAREPAPMLTTIPFISPILGMVRHNSRLYTHLLKRYPLPIFTLRLPGTRLYIISATSLIPAVQRQWQTLSFIPIEARAAETFMGVSKEGVAIIKKDLTTDKGFVPGFIKAMHPALSTGPELDDLNRQSIQVISKSLDKIAAAGTATTVGLYKWVQRELFNSTTDAIFGPQNPMKRPEMAEAWYVYEAKLMILMLHLPSFMARDAIKARQAMTEAFLEYFNKKHHETASGFIKRRFEYMSAQGLSLTDIARFEVGGIHALVSNTIPSAYWLVYRLFSDPGVLQDCRGELQREAVREEDGVSVLDVASVRDSCPVLRSTYQETLRFHGAGSSARVALEDHMLDGKYLIKKGGTVLIPTKLQHQSEEAWGSNVQAFSHKRFVRDGGTRYNMVAFRGFGGGTTLCPGRHFATTEILLFASMAILRFDAAPVDTDTADWPFPTAEKSSQSAAMDHPDYDFSIALQPRDDKEWSVSFTRSEKAANVTEEDDRAGK